MSFSQPKASPPPLAVVALGGNALSPPTGGLSYKQERSITAQTCDELAQLIRSGFRLLVVHGNGPQVGRLMRNDVEGENLDICVAQTQGELGYLIAQGIQNATPTECVSIVTRTVVDEHDSALKQPDKAVGPVLSKPPTGPSRPSEGGWRILVGSPKPLGVVELPGIRTLLQDYHVVAGGGGGVAVTATGEPVQGVVDKDRVAALLAIELQAAHLIFVTDVDGIYKHFAKERQSLVRQISCTEIQSLLDAGELGAGSMAPKAESAAAYVAATGQAACIVGLGDIVAGIQQSAGTQVVT